MSRHSPTHTNVASVIANGFAAVFAVLLRLAKPSWYSELIGLDVVQQGLDRQERLPFLAVPPSIAAHHKIVMKKSGTKSSSHFLQVFSTMNTPLSCWAE